MDGLGLRTLALWVLATAIGLQSAGAVGAGERVAPGDRDEVTVEAGERVVELFPVGDPYPDYIADLHRPGFALVRMWAGRDGIADSGPARFNLKLGARFGLIRVRPRAAPAGGWQLGLVAGLDAIFDLDRDYDNIGWDGNYGLVVTAPAGDRAAWKLGLVHTSSHIGDEYAERTGRRRIGYTREEVVAGLAWRVRPRWRSYLELGWGYELRNAELQEPGRAQTGLEYERPKCLWGGRLGYYAALDVSATEETEWRLDTALQLGLSALVADRRWRLGIEIYGGRPPLGEFFQDEETYVDFGLWMDL